MSPSQKRIFALLLLMATAVFILVALPNAAASQNMSMVQMFEPDEAAPLPAMLHMIAPAPSLDQTLRYFVFYDYYFYGFPFFASSALAVLPLQWLGHIQDLPLVMLALRQLISVLPMLAALLLLVYLQDGFRTYRSPVLFAFLLSVPAVLANDFWWHADSLTFLAVALTLFFLARDNLRFGRNFLLAAVTCAIATATKLVGADFFLAVGLALLLGFVLKKASWKKTGRRGAGLLAGHGRVLCGCQPIFAFPLGADSLSQHLQKPDGPAVTGLRGRVRQGPGRFLADHASVLR